jgi:hypothetical protein
MESGTHCDKHCVCPCKLCVEERIRIALLKQEKKEKRAKKSEIKTLFELMPTKEQLYARPFDAPPPASEPE